MNYNSSLSDANNLLDFENNVNNIFGNEDEMGPMSSAIITYLPSVSGRRMD